MPSAGVAMDEKTSMGVGVKELQMPLTFLQKIGVLQNQRITFQIAPNAIPP